MAFEGVVLEKIELRWLRWDKMLNNKEYEIVIKEFDQLLSKNQVVVGDYVRRNQALDELGVNRLEYKLISLRKVRHGKV